MDVLCCHDLSGVDVADQPGVMEQVVEQVHAGFDLAGGLLLRAVLFDVGVGRRPVLFLAVHHLVVDGVSWRILLEDLDTAYRQAVYGQRVGLDAKTTSFRDWALRLSAHAAAGGCDDEVGYWAGVIGAADPALPVDRVGVNSVASTRSVSVRLDPEQTRALLQDVPGVYRTQVNDVLLAALGVVLAGWTGRDRVLLDLEGHGREELFDGVDLSRTVGWFTTMFPVAVELTDPRDWETTLKSVKEQLRTVPGRGLGYGALRYLTETSGLAGGAAPQLSFNYLGQFDWPAAGDGLYHRCVAAWSSTSARKRTPDAPTRHRGPGRAQVPGADLALLYQELHDDAPSCPGAGSARHAAGRDRSLWATGCGWAYSVGFPVGWS